MSHEDFVTYEQAKKLADLGFDYRCIACYDEEEFDYTGEYNNYNSGHYDLISAPTITQAQKWLFEEKKIYIEIYCTNYLNNFGYELKFDYDSNNHYCTQGFINSNEALSRGIDDAIRYLELLNEEGK